MYIYDPFATNNIGKQHCVVAATILKMSTYTTRLHSKIHATHYLYSLSTLTKIQDNVLQEMDWKINLLFIKDKSDSYHID